MLPTRPFKRPFTMGMWPSRSSWTMRSSSTAAATWTTPSSGRWVRARMSKIEHKFRTCHQMVVESQRVLFWRQSIVILVLSTRSRPRWAPPPSPSRAPAGAGSASTRRPSASRSLLAPTRTHFRWERNKPISFWILIGHYRFDSNYWYRCLGARLLLAV